MTVLTVIALAIGLLALGLAGMALNILVKKGGKFPNTHVSGNKYLREQGVSCSQSQDKMEQKKAWSKVNYEKVKFTPQIKLEK